MSKSQTTLDSLFKFEKSSKKFSYKSDENIPSEEEIHAHKDSKNSRKNIIPDSDSDENLKQIKTKDGEINSKTSLKQTDLGRLFEMFPTTSKLKIKTIWKKSKFSVKDAINWILEEDKQNSDKSDDDDNELSESSNESNKSGRKRKQREENKENIAEPLKKKHRVVIESSSEDEKKEKSLMKKRFKKIESDSELEDIQEENRKAKSKKQKKLTKIKDDENDEDDRFSENSSNSSNSNLNGSEINLRISIFKFFNSSSADEILSMISASTKKIDLLIGLRPFLDYKDMKRRLSENSLSALLESAKEIFISRENVNDLMTNCEQISKKLHTQISKAIDKTSLAIDMNTTSLKIKSQPSLLNPDLKLKPYQLIGLNWLCLIHSEKLNGILADEMGLGKTIQAIAFLAFLLESGFTGVHLIVVPPSTLDNWLNEIELWCPSLNYLVYSGSQDERRNLRYDILENMFEKPLNVLITTYSLVSSTAEDKSFFRKMKFDYCVFDEAHMLKNMSSIRYQSLIKITSKRKLLLTGTPLQNNLIELMSLLNFVMPDIFNNRTHHINKLFATKQASDSAGSKSYYEHKINQAKSIMKPFILRRLKTEVLQHLPKKTVHTLQCKMSARQLKEYTELINCYVSRSEELASKNDKKSTENAANIIMELRKAANHPLLRRCLYNEIKLKEMAKLVLEESTPDTVFEYVYEDMCVMSDFQLHKLCDTYKSIKKYQLNSEDILDSGKLKALNTLLAEKKARCEKVLIFSQFVIMLDILEEYLNIKEYKFIRLDGSTAVDERQDMIDEFNKDKDIFVFLLSTRAGGMGINLTSANVVILHDIDYNPFNDKQAEDRCHRVGQTKEVEIYKLISTDSIDESMLKIQARKIELGENLTNETNESQTKSDMVSLLKEALKIH